jgi:hypothetical protein
MCSIPSCSSISSVQRYARRIEIAGNVLAFAVKRMNAAAKPCPRNTIPDVIPGILVRLVAGQYLFGFWI